MNNTHALPLQTTRANKIMTTSNIIHVTTKNGKIGLSVEKSLSEARSQAMGQASLGNRGKKCFY